MKKNDMLNIMNDQLQTGVISTVNEKGLVVSKVINIIIENEKIFFFIAKGQELFESLQKNNMITLVGYSQQNALSLQTINMSGKVREISEELSKELIKKDVTILQFYNNPKALNILQGYEIYEYHGDYIDFSHNYIQRDFFSSSQSITAKVYQVTGLCIYCKACFRVCPQKCIDITKKPVRINVNHCLQCGKCAEICPRKAITKTDIQLFQ